MQTTGFSCKIFFVTFVNEKSRYKVVYLMSNGCEVGDKRALLIKWVEP